MEQKILSLAQRNRLLLADFIAAGKYEFDMVQAFADIKCGTAGCIGGHATVLWPDTESLRHWNKKKLAAKLGISETIFENMCLWAVDGDGVCIDLWDVTRSMAVAMLRRLAFTDEMYFDRSE